MSGRHCTEHDKQRDKELKEDRSVTVLVNKKGSPGAVEREFAWEPHGRLFTVYCRLGRSHVTVAGTTG